MGLRLLINHKNFQERAVMHLSLVQTRRSNKPQGNIPEEINAAVDLRKRTRFVRGDYWWSRTGQPKPSRELHRHWDWQQCWGWRVRKYRGTSVLVIHWFWEGRQVPKTMSTKQIFPIRNHVNKCNAFPNRIFTAWPQKLREDHKGTCTGREPPCDDCVTPCFGCQG